MPQLPDTTSVSIKFLLSNCWFLIPFVAVCCVGIAVALNMPLGEEVFWLNANRTPFWDKFFIYFTMLGEFGSYLIVWYLVYRLRPNHAKVFPLLIVMVLGLSFSAKKFFDEPRPYYYFRIEQTHERMIPFEEFDFRQGTMSFPSGHTMSAFALAAFLAFSIKKKKELWSIFLVILAAGVALSRVYLGQHFAKDVVFGALLGTMIAMVVFLWGNNLVAVLKRSENN